ncbi:uncharacterized protein LOC144702243 [Wolffia australiana]
MMHSVDIARAHEILARYRPIAPRPAPPPQSGSESPSATPPGKPAGARVARPKKRSRGACSCSVLDRKRAKYVTLLPTPETTKVGLSGSGFPLLGGQNFQAEKPGGCCADLLALSLLPFSPTSSSSSFAGPSKKVKLMAALDLNSEPDLDKPHVITPQPVRPVGSSICVGSISEDKGGASVASPAVKKPEEVEEEVESEALPAVISDSNNRVRLANSAYKKMVGQPECSWLDFMGSKRINGEVMLDLSGSAVPTSSNRFSCSVTIEWACNGRRTFIRAPCDVNKLFCESKNYYFAWRIRTEVSGVNCQT